MKGAEAPVVVVGAGLAGLTTALALSSSGVPVEVFEARDRLGGRAHSVSAADGVLERGATWFWPNEPKITEYGRRFDVPVYRQHLDGDALLETPRSGAQLLRGNPLDVPSYRFVGGVSRLVRALAAALPVGCVHLQEPVEAIATSEDGITISTRTGGIQGRQVVVAVPPALAVEQIVFTPALPATLRAALAEPGVWMSGMVKAIAVYESAFWRTRGLSGSAMSHVGPFREFHDHSGPEGSPPALFGFAPSTGVPAGTDLGAAFRDQLARLFGAEAAAPVHVEIADWSREPYTAPGGTRAQRAAEASGSSVGSLGQDRVHWAATEVAPAFAGHLEGAIRAGESAAQAVMAGIRAQV